MERLKFLTMGVLVLGIMFSGVGQVFASVACTTGGGVQVGTECQIQGLVNTPCPYTLTLLPGEDLRITSTGSIQCNDSGASGASAQDITIDVQGGDMIMEAGSKILAENTNDGGSGGDITITVSGNMTMCGQAGLQTGCGGASANPGALISSQKTGGAGDTGDGGNISITVGNISTLTGDFYMEGGSTGYGTETGATIISTGTGPAGDITITVGANYFAEPGSVVEAGDGKGSAVQQGGKIFLVSGCKLTTQGRVTSKGTDKGSDLVHLESCDVLVQGLVESTGKGHTVAANPAQPNVAPFNSCDGFPDGLTNEVIRTGKPANATACIEVWGNTITIDSTSPFAGELNADIGDGGSGGTSWIDIFARSNLTVTDGTGNDRLSSNIGDSGQSYFSTYAVHANAVDGSDNTPNVVTALVKNGPLTASGKAFEASSTMNINTGHGNTDPFVGNGSTGGTIQLEASGTVTLDDAFLNASGDIAGGNPCPIPASGACGDGGHIIVKAWGTGSDISWQTGDGDVRPNDSGGSTVGGDITLNACDTITLGADFHGEVPSTSTGGANCDATKPDIPGYVTLPPANCEQLCQGGCKGSITIVKKVTFPVGDEQDFCFTGTFPNFCLDDDANPPLLNTITFPDLDPGTYTVTEQVPPGWTLNNIVCDDPNGNTTVDKNSATATIKLDQTDDTCENITCTFFDSKPVCKEDPTAVCTRNVGPGMTYSTLQAAYDAAVNGDTICMFSNTVENVVLGDHDGIEGDKTLKITQCTVAKITAADNSKPVWKITSAGKLTIVGPDAVGGSEGWKVVTNGHELKGLRATGASGCGILIQGNSNSVGWNSANSNGVGVCVEGDFNTLKGGTVQGNAGAGVQFTAAANNNTLSGATIQYNTGNGVWIEGSSNTVKSNKVLYNSPNGFLVSGTGNSILSNTIDANTGDGVNVTGTNNLFQDNKVSKNTGDGFDISGTGNKLKSNASNNGSSGGSSENGGYEYRLTIAAVNQGGNKADGIGVPKTTVPTKCPTFPAAGTLCE